MQNNTQDKKVGVVIPIYNVAQYLRECIDSVLSQTYKNLSIVLVNDGSTDNESLDIAKEYVAKDPRFILIDKENGGLSSARNVGIAWYSEKYETKLDNSKDSFFVAQNDNQNNNNNNKETFILLQYDIVNENPYNVYKIYANKEDTNSLNENDKEIKDKSLQPEKIDYIIFLDSDDYWRLDCIDRCMEYSDGVDIVWFDYECYFDNIKPVKGMQKTYLQFLGFKEGRITSNYLLESFLNQQLDSFSWAWQGIIDFKFLKYINVYFLDGVFAEDHLFAALLFLQSKFIYVIPEPFYVYRIRINSLCDFSSSNNHIPKHLERFCNIFDNKKDVRSYHVASSWFIMLLELVSFVKNNPSSNDSKIEKFFFPYYAQNSLKILDLEYDPMGLIPKMQQIEKYLKKGFKYKHKLRITNPQKYKQLKPIFDYCSFTYGLMKKFERSVRLMIKNN